MYKPLDIKQSSKPSEATSLMSPSGVNKRTAPQFLDINYALTINNYIIIGEGELEKRKGLTTLFSVAGTNSISLFKKWTDDIFRFGYGTTIA